jgi:hypothetical protein
MKHFRIAAFYTVIYTYKCKAIVMLSNVKHVVLLCDGRDVKGN